MAKEKNLIPATPKEIHTKNPIFRENESGQLTFFPSIIMKSTSPVFDIFGTYQNESSAHSILIDDTYGADATDDEEIPITTRVMINYDSLPAQMDKHLDAFDREIMDGVATLIQSNEMFTAKELCRIVLGKKKNYRISPAQSKNMVKRIDKLRHIDVTVNITDMAEKDSPIREELIRKGLKAKYTGYLFPAEYVEVEILSDYDCRLWMLRPPPIIEYALSLRKYRVFPIKYWDTSVNKNERTVVMQSYLMRTIDRMYRGDAKKYIAVNGIYQAINGLDASPQLKYRFRGMAETILNDWTKMGFIKGYSSEAVKQQIFRYAIELQDKNPIKEFESGMEGL